MRRLSIRQYLIFNAPDEFLRHLIKYKALEAYLEEMELGLNRTVFYKDRIDSILQVRNTSCLYNFRVPLILLRSFDWKYSKLGYHYWDNIYMASAKK